MSVLSDLSDRRLRRGSYPIARRARGVFFPEAETDPEAGDIETFAPKRNSFPQGSTPTAAVRLRDFVLSPWRR